jgi:hypothetical protein
MPDISSNVVGGVRVPCALEEAVLGSSVDNGPPEFDDNTGIDMRWLSFSALFTGDSGLLAVGVCEFRRANCEVESAAAQLGVASAAPFCEAGETSVGRACIDFAKVVISANKVAVRSHMKVFIVVVFRCDFGGIKRVS